MIEIRFTALPTWRQYSTLDRRGPWTFKASWQQTRELLDRELRLLEASDVIIGVQLQPGHIRVDGQLRANAPRPVHPGVEISFYSAAVAKLDPLVRRGEELIAYEYGNVAAARKKHHPDHGGKFEDIAAINAATEQKRLVYATDACQDWRHNVRSIALGLEALRAVDRYGISRRGEQYAGFRGALPAGAS